MTVSQLMEMLATMPKDAPVYEERQGDFRALTTEDVKLTHGVYDPDQEEEDEALMDRECVVFRAWQ